MSLPAENLRVVLASRPVGEPVLSDFRVESVPVPEVSSGQLLLRTRYLSLDPYMRGRMSDAKSYAEPMAVGDVMVGGTVCDVIESREPGIDVGDIVLAFSGWQQYAVADARHVRKLDPRLAPPRTALGVLGMPGFTAYAGLLEIGRPQPGETVVVAAASGPVGSAVGQIAKIKGARAVGIAGGPEKCAYLTELGFDAAIDHRAPNFAEQLAAAVPGGIDVYFENVGGAVWDAVLPLLNTYARVPVCGLISQYNRTSRPEGPDRAPALMSAILTRSLTIRGFIQSEFVGTRYADFIGEMSEWVHQGRVQYREDIVNGLENAPAAFIGMLEGRNFGKLIVNVGMTEQ
ncbi:NADP-dependent oxidoreductase [Rhodococcus kronopolitis]|uniref:NADP-dependent oxidoreductase n=1 Tax=Rhodococcus kronopolitis TaxID=1460226 RepID=A0ABV9FWK9_9NOCA